VLPHRHPPRRRHGRLERHRPRAGQAVRRARLRPRGRRRGRRAAARGRAARRAGRDRPGGPGRPVDRGGRGGARGSPAGERAARGRPGPERRDRRGRRLHDADGPRPGARARRPQRALHGPPGQARPAGHGRARPGPGALHLLGRVDLSRALPRGLQRVEVVRAVLRRGHPRGAQGHGRDRDLAHAGPDGDRVLRAGEPRGDDARRDEHEGRRRHGGQAGLRGAHGRQAAGRGRVAHEQGAGPRRPARPRRPEGQGARAAGQAGLGGV
ncbi:MAG: Putative short-chain dehydrogenase, partial [uncultured Solirubrobacteraceae bacterium]